ncbi:MAG TPA: DUF4446 family protein [Actinomycetota bacterium]|nr:DUF4446 family protein [Actinomycetota bacterium]
MNLSNSVLSILAVTGVSLGALCLLLLIGQAMRQRADRERSPLPPNERIDVLIDAHGRSIKRLEQAMVQLADGEKRLAELMQGAIQRVGVVRFDAFEDMGGRLSFSAAILNANGDGLVITSINGRQDTRCYAKQVRAGTSIHNLSGEEEQAIRDAMSRANQAVGA